jgi:F-type H+-transporting ATPase subunit gamma
MAQIREIKRRIKTSKNISQVTRAMEMVSAVKMKKSQETALTGREYTKALENMVRVLASQKEDKEKSVFLAQPEEIKKVLLIVIAPKKGLCGPLVGNIQRTVANFVLNNQEFKNAEFSFLTLGKKSLDIVKVFGKNVVADFEIFDKGLEINAIEPISEFAVKQIVSNTVDAVFVAYTEFVSTIVQKPVIKQFLPIPKTEVVEVDKKTEKVVIFEPNSKEVLESLVLKYTEGILYQFFLESSASEHSARMVAMKNAHDSADDIISDLSLYYNKIRQNTITTELADSVSSRLGQEQ